METNQEAKDSIFKGWTSKIPDPETRKEKQITIRKKMEEYKSFEKTAAKEMA